MVSFYIIFMIFAGTFVVSNRKLSDQNKSGFFIVLAVITLLVCFLSWIMG